MATTFVENLFNSIFTPGPTPTLLVATNISFAALQLILLLLLISTYSIHFLVLSFLSAGLWWSINWFVAELKLEAEKERLRKEKEGVVEGGSETEAEADGSRVVDVTDREMQNSGSKEVEVLDASVGELKDRRGLLETPTKGMDGSRSEISTEDEWERVEESEKDK
jgi:hypothetical protein